MKIWRKRTEITVEVREVTTYRTATRVCEHCGKEMSEAPAATLRREELPLLDAPDGQATSPVLQQTRIYQKKEKQ